MYVVHTYIGYKNRTRSRTNLSQNGESHQSIDDTCVFWVLGMLLEWKNLTHPRVSGFLGLYRGERVIKYGLNRVFREPLISLKMLQWQSKLFIALIVIRNSPFFWQFEDMKTQKYGIKTLYCSHSDNKFVLFWHFEDMTTQKIWCQNFLLLSLW